MTSGSAAPAADVEGLTREYLQTLITWAALYQEVGPTSPLVAAEQDRLDAQKRRLGHLAHETRYLAPVALTGASYAGQ